MTGQKDPSLILEQMLEAAEEAISFVEGYAKADFLADKRTCAAVSMHLMMIGELAHRLIRDACFAQNHPELSLSQMLGMRNRIAHGYLEIDMTVVWDTITTALPELVQTVSALLHAANAPSGSPAIPSDSDS